MSKRAELRRIEKEQKKKSKVYQYTEEQLEELLQKEYKNVRKNLMDQVDQLTEEIFKMMLVIPTNVLISDYCEKTAEKRIPKFVDDCIKLYKSWQSGNLKMDEMQKLTEKYAKTTLLEPGTIIGKSVEKYEQKR